MRCPWKSIVSIMAFFMAGLEPTQKDSPIKKIPAEEILFDIDGYYTCKGNEASGKTYTGVATIAKVNEIYVVSWNMGLSSFSGVGIRQGENLAVSWSITAEGGKQIKGVNFYKIKQGPRLIGVWATLPGNGLMRRESLTFLKPFEKEE